MGFELKNKHHCFEQILRIVSYFDNINIVFSVITIQRTVILISIKQF